MLIKTNQEDLKSYLEDTSNIKGQANILYIPENVDELKQAVSDCVSKNTPFTLLAGKTGTTGGCVSQSGALISIEKLNKINFIDKEKKIVDLQAGVSLADLCSEINAKGLALKATPTESLALIGGVISTCASGVRGFGYGSIRKYVRALDILLTTGDLIKIKRGQMLAMGRKFEFDYKNKKFEFDYKNKKFEFDVPFYTMPVVKSQAGYYVYDDMDLVDLFIGSEGTLGIITNCQLRLQEKPTNIFDGLVFFNDEQSAFGFVNKVRAIKEILKPTSLEFFDANTLRMLEKEYSFIPSSSMAAVYFEQEAEQASDCDSLMDQWAKLIEESNACINDSIIADTPGDRAKLFDFRHMVPQMINEYLRQSGQVKVATDIAVPWDRFMDMYGFYKKCAEQVDISYVNFGHIGESHLHFNFLPKNDEESIKAKEALRFFCQMAVSLGGTVSAEHGIGKIKKSYLKIMYSQDEITAMARVKNYLDPNWLIGLDNIFEKEILAQI